MIKKILPLLLMLLFVSTVYADTYMGLKPGLSTREDADRVMGKPIREVIKGSCYDYSPKEHQARRLSLKFRSETQVIETINIYFIESYSKEQLKEMFDLGKPSKAVTGEDGNLTEYYGSKGVSFHFTGPGDDAPVDFFSHFDPASAPWVTPPAERPRDVGYYIRESDSAIEKMRWAQAKQIIEEGVQKFPNSAELWRNRAVYYLESSSESEEKRSTEALQSMKKAYELKPIAEYAAQMGRIYSEAHNDCRTARTYFEEAETKGYAQKKPALYYWMGRCYEETGDTAKSKNYYNRFIKEAPDDKKIKDAQNRLAELSKSDQRDQYEAQILTDDTPCGPIKSDQIKVPNDFEIVFSTGPTHAEWGPKNFTTLHADGRYTVWELGPVQNDAGNESKKVIRETILSSGKVKSIYAQVMACDFFSMETVYANPGFRDGEYGQIFVRANGRSHRVSVYYYHVKRFESIKEALLSQGSSVSVQFQDQDDFEHPSDNTLEQIIKKDERYYIQASDSALEKKEWQRAKKVIEKGLQKFPNSADLWHSRSLYYFRCKAESKRIRRIEVQRSMDRAYKLRPSGKHAGEMGWLYHDLHGDCETALSYFEEAERKGYAKEKKRLLYWMGECYEKRGYYQLSRDYYRRFIHAAPQDEKAADARHRLRRLR